MMNKSVVLKRSISALLCIAMSVSLCAFAGMAQAKTSLPVIEEIKTSDEVFTILEIVPDDTQGSIGYYIDGQEPWVKLVGKKSKDKREEFVEKLQELLNKSREDEKVKENNYSLELCNPDSNDLDDGYPLTYAENYKEIYPWEWANDPDGLYKDYKQMPLEKAETATATGNMDYVGIGKGDYNVNYEYVKVGGNYRQIIKEFKTESEEGEEGYWYNVTFKELEKDDTDIDPWNIIYEEASEEDDNYITVSIEDTQKELKTVGVVGDRDFPGLDINNTYYKATWGSAYISKEEAASENVNTLFADMSAGFREVEENGDFSKISYEYVGNGNGAYTFTPSDEGIEFKLSTKIVYYIGGFKNNNWFLKYVMGYEEDELDDSNVKVPEIHVNTVKADKINKAQYDAADMIVLNYGLDINGETFSEIFKNDFISTDFEDTNLVGLIGTTKKPIIFDYNLISSESTLVKDTAGKLFEKAQIQREGSEFSESTHTFVGGNIYCIDSLGWTEGEDKESVPHSALPLATVNFNNTDSIEGGYLLKEEPFYPVFEEIRYENYLRELRGLSEEEKLSEEITMASVIRYIINYRKIDTKTTVRVLDIEPRTGSIDPEKKGKLAEWLKISSKNLDVTTMSTSEFIGIQKDISEEYDILYIGDSAKGFNTRSTTISDFSFTPLPTLKLYNFDYITYNDDTMKFNRDADKSSINKQSVSKYLDNSGDAKWILDPRDSEIVFGMRYTSTGDKVKSGKVKLGDVDYNLSGLLDRDYNEDSTIKISGDTNLFRYSGNDLTEAASEKIKDFANSGHTLILADTLLQPPIIDDKTKKATATLRKTNFSARPDISVAGSILKVSLERPEKNILSYIYFIDSASCTLYKNDETVKDEKGKNVVKTITPFSSVSFDLSNYDYKVEDKFYCKVEITKVRYPLLPIFIVEPKPSKEGKTATVTIRGNAEDMFVDNSSVMYETINDIVGKTNVMNWTTLDNEVTDIGQTILPRLVNLSKPTIEFWKDRYPTSYEMKDGEMNCLKDDDRDGIYELDYVFRIKNDSDPYPGKTRYKVNLYLDMNGNGLYDDDEVVNDVGLRNWTVYDSYGRAGLRVKNGELLGSYGNERDDQHYYYLTYEIPSNMVGIIPWKLKIEDVNYVGGHDSVTDYTRVVPKDEPNVLQILQIDSTDEKHFSLQENIEGGGKYKTLLDAVESDFKVNVATIKADFDSKWIDNETSYTTETNTSDGTKTLVKLTKEGDEYKKTISIDGEDDNSETYSNITELFESYDMLIIGFGDAYRDLSLNVSKALAEYIDADKPVLMTHDTTSYYSYKSDKSYGYYTNMLIRDRIGMDRYGVTSLKSLSNGKTAGITKYADSDLAGYLKELFGIEEWEGGYVPSNDYYSNGSKINKDHGKLLDEIKNAGYSIAWKAGEKRKQTVSETQGLTNAVLFRFMDISIFDWFNADSYNIKYDKDNDEHRLGLTTKVTQVNKGQITTYPYDINTQDFGGTKAELKVSETHAQNYQLNMNSDDMIVWYCLAPNAEYGKGIYQKNDVTNAYYIYTCGNVTYTGSGHTTNTINENEAKLFVNTMIAAYRVGRSGSNVSFSNDDGTVKGIESFFVPTDGKTILKLDGATDNSRNIYFTVNDSNVGISKKLIATFSYSGDILQIPIYEADYNEEVYNEEEKLPVLTSTYTYYIKLDDLLGAIEETTGKDVTVKDLNNDLTVTLSTTYNEDEDSETSTMSEASIKLRQNKLFDLS